MKYPSLVAASVSSGEIHSESRFECKGREFLFMYFLSLLFFLFLLLLLLLFLLVLLLLLG